MAQAQSRRYTIYIDNTEAQRNLDLLKTRAASLTAEIARIQSTGGNATRQMQQLANTQQQIGSLEQSIRSGLTRSLRDLQSEVSRTENLLRRATDPETIRQLNAQLVIARQNLLEYRANVLGIASAQAQLAAQSANLFTRLQDGIKASLFGNLLATGISTLIAGIKQAVSESIDLALKAQGIRRAFQQIDDPNLLNQLRAATRGTVSDLELMRKAVNANNFGIPIQNLGTYFAFAHQRAMATGEDVDYLANSIVLGISRKSLPILDNLGLSASRINENFAKTGSMAAAVSQIINEEMEKSGRYVDTYADKVGRISAKWKNVKESFGNGLIDIADDFSNQWDIMFGTKEEHDAALEADLNKILDRQQFMKNYRQDELKRLDAFKKAYGDGTKKGDNDLIRIAKEFIETNEKLQEDANERGSKAQQRQLSYRLDIWRGFYSNLKKLQQNSGDTLGGKQSELDLLNAQLQTLDIKSKEFKNTQARIKQLQKEIDDASGKTAEAAAAKAKQFAEKEGRHKEQLAKQLDEFINKYTSRQLSGYDKEIFDSETRYNELRKQLVKYGIDAKQLDESQMQERIHIYQKFSAAQAGVFGKTRDLLADTPQARIKKGQVDSTARLMNALDGFVKDQARRNKDDVDAAELLVMTTHGAKQLEARKQLLEAQKKQELDNVNLTATERAKIEEEYRQKDWDTEVDYYSRKVDQYTGYLGSILSVYESWSSLQKQKEDKELAKDKALNDKKKDQYKKQLDAKIISQSEYDRKVSALDAQLQAKEAAMKKKQFEREKIANITKAVMGTAQAVVQALTAGPFLGPILAAATAAIGAVQIGIIAAQKAPEYGKGGKLVGPKHDSEYNGMPVVNPATGQVQAYLEGDEGILRRSAMYDKRQYTATGTISQIASMFNSMHGGTSWDGGARLHPGWMNYSAKPVNFSGLSTTMTNVRTFATGGRYASDTTTPVSREPTTIDPELKAMLVQNSQVLAQLSAQLTGGIQAFVEIKQLQTQQDRLEAIRQAATFKK